MEQAILGLVAAVLTAATAFIQQWVKTRLTPARLDTVAALTRTVVAAAEELGSVLSGPEKYEYAEAALIKGAKRVGVRLDPVEANAFIHAILNEVHGDEAEREALYAAIAEGEAGDPEVPEAA